jgi:CpeS-like protein
MDIQAFFQLCDGKWISQRTTHQLLEQNNKSGRSDLWGEILEATDGDVVTLCQQLNVDSSQALCGLRLRWSEVAEAYESKFKKKDEGSALMVAIANPSSTATHPASVEHASGQLLRSLNTAHAGTGTFSIGADEALTLRFEDADTVLKSASGLLALTFACAAAAFKKTGLFASRLSAQKFAWLPQPQHLLQNLLQHRLMLSNTVR